MRTLLKLLTSLVVAFLTLIMFLVFLFIYNRGFSKGVDQRTIELCKWYARQDHSGEIGKERLEKMGHLWTNFNWFESCMENNK